MKQLPLLKKSDLKTPKAFFGGALLKGKRKAQRPLSRKKPIHLVMRSEKAVGRGSKNQSERLLASQTLYKNLRMGKGF